MNIKTDKLVSWALVNKQNGNVEVLDFTRQDVREAKKLLAKQGIETKIAKLNFTKWDR